MLAFARGRLDLEWVLVMRREEKAEEDGGVQEEDEECVRRLRWCEGRGRAEIDFDLDIWELVVDISTTGWVYLRKRIRGRL